MNTQRKKIIFLAICLAGLFTVTAEEYSLSRYLVLVEKNNLDLQLADQTVKAARESERQSLSALLPSVAATGGYTRNLTDVDQSTAVAAGTTAVNGVYPLIHQDIDSNYDNELTMAIALTQKLIDPAAIASYKAAKKNTEMQRAVTEYTRQQVLNGAKKLYAQVQLLQAVAQVKTEVTATSEAVYHDTEKKYNAGTATEVSLRMAEVDWKSDISSQSEAEKNVRVAMMAFKVLADIPFDTDVVLTEDTGKLPPLPAAAELGKVLGARQDYQASVLAKETTDIALRASKASFLPTVSGSFSYAYGQYGGYAGQDDWDAYDYKASSIGVNVTIPLFTGGSRLSAIKSARIQQDQLNIQLKQKRNDIQQSLQSLELQMDEARKQIDSARALESATDHSLSITRTAFMNGVNTQLEVSKAMTQYANARLNLQNAIYNYRTAYYDYELACGKTGTAEAK
jgi:outer membrane protein TolC